MEGDTRVNHLPNNGHKSMTRAKSGCRTCKIRKVKCDEGRPACRRCVSTSRVCDGYGIWGGGGNFYGHRQMSTAVSTASSVAPRPQPSISILAAGTEEKRYYEWFKCRTVKKIPGAFVLTFWDTLIFQVSLTEPAVLHAVLTLSSLHKREILDFHSQSRSHEIPDEQDQFMLKQYNKAINYLQPHFSNKDRSSVRVALITCVVFICIELLRGHFQTAITHLQKGLMVLREMQSPTSTSDYEVLLLPPSREPIDDWIAEAFSRLHVQVMLFKQSYYPSCLIVQDPGPESPILVYRSLNEAWKQIERSLNKIFHLAKQGSQQQASEYVSVRNPSALIMRQQHIQAELTQWLDTYEASRNGLKELEGRDSKEFVCQLLRIYHSMAYMMAQACLSPGDETIFDAYEQEFVSMIDQSINLWKVGTLVSQSRVLPGHYLHMSGSVVDIGWIPPLYHTALRCRIHRVRLQAIRLLESSSHREGIWDAKIAACVARKVMEIEERDFYKDFNTNDDFPLSSSPGVSDLLLPILPQSYRIREVKVVLPDDPMDSIFLFYRQKQRSGDWKALSKEYNVLSQCWVDG